MNIEQALPWIGATTAAITFVVCGVDWLIRKWLQKHRDELILSLNKHIESLNAAEKALTIERDSARSELAGATLLNSTITADLIAARQKIIEMNGFIEAKDAALGELTEVKAALDKEQKANDGRIRRALNLEGAIWTQPVMANTPPFVPLPERRTPIVSVLNLKGGVGKTTLTAYLGWALSARGYRVLLLDLDLQGSLSSLLLGTEELLRWVERKSLLQHYLADSTASGKGKRRLIDYAAPVPQLNSRSRLVAATDKLAYAELTQTVRWLLRVGAAGNTWNGRRDGRMILRRALHAKGLYKKFDIILLDCPPLINLCCANALAASDYLLTPLTPSRKAIERVTPLLRRVAEVRERGVNPKLNVLGIVVNRTDGRELSPTEEQLFVNLPGDCISVYGQRVYRFDTVIQQRVAVRDAENYFEVPDEKHPLRSTFEALAEEFIKQLPRECRTPDERVRDRISRKQRGVQ